MGYDGLALLCRELSSLREEETDNQTQNFVHVRRYVCTIVRCVLLQSVIGVWYELLLG